MPDAQRRAVFLDRDGTVVEDPGYLHQAEHVRLLPSAGAATRRLNDAGFLVVMVSNQSGIARGLYDEAAYAAVQHRLAELLKHYGAHVDAAYFCPHHPEVSGPCDCRKPGLKLFRVAQAALRLAFARSFWVGDRLSDIEPARALGGGGGGHAYLVETGHGAQHRAQARVLGVPVVPDLAAAVEQIVRVT